MKNKHFERRREAAKRYKKTLNYGVYPAGVKIYHSYTNPMRQTYWDDFAFMLGAQAIIVTWSHPRKAYIDATESEAFDLVQAQHGDMPEWDMFNSKGVTFKRIGKSRKKATAVAMSPLPEEVREYLDLVRDEKKRLKAESSFVAKPSIQIEQWGTGRHVELVYPVELRNELDIIAFAAKLKQHLLGRGDMFAHLSDYRYTAADWLAEQEETI